MAMELQAVAGRWESEPAGRPRYEQHFRGGRHLIRAPIRFEGDLTRGAVVGGRREGVYPIFTTIPSEMVGRLGIGVVAATDASVAANRGTGIRRAWGWMDVGEDPYSWRS